MNYSKRALRSVKSSATENVSSVLGQNRIHKSSTNEQCTLLVGIPTEKNLKNSADDQQYERNKKPFIVGHFHLIFQLSL